MENKKSVQRRNFLKATVAGAVGVGVAGSAPVNLMGGETKADLGIKSFRMLGKTGFKVSDISMGYSNNVAVIQGALRAGVNYIDTAEVYRNQPAVGKAIKEGGFDRKKIFITSKLVIDKKKEVTKESFVKRFNQCLKELQTDYIDCMMIHSCEDLETMKTPGFHAAMDQMKKEGKLKHVGISNHGTNWYMKPKVSMSEILTAAANDGRFDVMLLAYNFVQDDMGAKVLELCKKKNIGTTLMKVNPVGTFHKMKERAKKIKEAKRELDEFTKSGLAIFEAKAKKAEGFIKKYKLDNQKEISDAAIKFTLDNNDVATVCCGMRNFEQMEGFIKLSGTRLNGREKKKLAAFKAGPAIFYCRHACGICESACKHNVPVNTIMRYHHYFDAHGREKYAMKQYAGLKTNKADLCASCKGDCQSACPYGVAIHGMMNIAHSNLEIG